MPASSLVAVQRSPDGRMAMTSSAFATSMPTNTEAAGGIVEPPRCGRSTEARPCRIRADARATVRALAVERKTPTLTLGLGDRQIELSPVVVRFMAHSINRGLN